MLARWRSVAKHPGVLAGTTALHRHHFGIGLGGNPGQATGQYPITLGRGHGVHAHADGPRLQLALLGLPYRRLGQLRQLLGHVGVRPGLDASGQGLALGRVEITTEYRAEALRGERRLDQQLGHLLQRPRHHRWLTAPPGGDGRQAQVFSEQALVDRR
ncbi:hypothetical protein D3C76_786310 [compost metagenome]